jgi:hypothetical protein
MQGRRILATRVDEHGKAWYPPPHEGDYWRDDNTGTWFCRVPGAPAGVWGNLADHQVTEHDDGTITVSPSILVDGGSRFQWHGYLERGQWREVG